LGMLVLEQNPPSPGWYKKVSEDVSLSAESRGMLSSVPLIQRASISNSTLITARNTCYYPIYLIWCILTSSRESVAYWAGSVILSSIFRQPQTHHPHHSLPLTPPPLTFRKTRNYPTELPLLFILESNQSITFDPRTPNFPPKCQSQSSLHLMAPTSSASIPSVLRQQTLGSFSKHFRLKTRKWETITSSKALSRISPATQTSGQVKMASSVVQFRLTMLIIISKFGLKIYGSVF